MLWQKGVAPEDWVTRFTVGDDYRWDTLLLPYDIDGTRVQAWSLTRTGVLSDDEFAAVDDSLSHLQHLVEDGSVTVSPEDEDCHTVIERFLTERLGETGKKIHTGRSRNDQVLVALRLFLRENLHGVAQDVLSVADTLCDFGEDYDGYLMPGYTHLQRAMPSTPGLWSMGYAELLAGDLAVLRHVYDQIGLSPLGSAAGYGAPYLNLPRQEAAERLGFDGVQIHATAVQLSRGKLELQVVHALVQVAHTINRMASDLVLFNTAEFGFVELPAEFCTGSSIMPQKQNPDVLELARASYHRLVAEMQVLLTLPANLPSGYHRDLQLTKEAVMRAVLLARDLLRAMEHLLPGVRFMTDRMQAATTPELFATADALERVRGGTPFREAYRAAAEAVGALKRTTPEDALAAYGYDGTPGHCRPDLVREALAPYREWATG